jgi:hypothetical protein
MLAAGRHRESTTPMFGDGSVEVQDDEDDVIEAADRGRSAS